MAVKILESMLSGAVLRNIGSFLSDDVCWR